MSSFSRRAFCISGFAAVSACGFRPVYGPGGGGNRLRGSVRLEEPEGRDAFLFARRAEERLGRGPASARYALSYAISIHAEAIAISPDNVTQRFNLRGRATYALRDTTNGAVVQSGKLENFNGYSASGSTVATQAAERDARERLMTILADQMIARLLAAAPDLPE